MSSETKSYYIDLLKRAEIQNAQCQKILRKREKRIQQLEKENLKFKNKNKIPKMKKFTSL